jgi:hypothetical protein
MLKPENVCPKILRSHQRCPKSIRFNLSDENLKLKFVQPIRLTACVLFCLQSNVRCIVSTKLSCLLALFHRDYRCLCRETLVSGDFGKSVANPTFVSYDSSLNLKKKLAAAKSCQKSQNRLLGCIGRNFHERRVICQN